MKPNLFVAGCTLALLLSGCGDGGGGGVASASAPLPSPAPSPTPTPTPTPTQPAGFTPTVTPTETLPGTTASVSPNGGPRVEEILDSSRVAIGRDAAGNYLITVPVSTGQATGLSEGFLRRFEFLAANRTTTASGMQQYSLGRSGSIFPNEKSFLTVLPAGTAANPLAHVNFAYLVACINDACSAADSPGGNIIAFGNRTVSDDIPVSGSASYTGAFATSFGPGYSAGVPPESDNTAGGGFDTAGQLAGTARLTVSFADKGVTGSLSNISDSTGWFSYTAEDVNHRIADFAMTGSFDAAGTLSGTIAAPAGTTFTGGNWVGMFFGPQAAEVGGSLILRAAPFAFPAEYAGYFGGAKD